VRQIETFLILIFHVKQHAIAPLDRPFGDDLRYYPSCNSWTCG